MILVVILLSLLPKDTKLYVPEVTLSARYNLKLLKLHSKGVERSVYWNEYKTKNENKNTANENRYFLKSNFFGVTILFFLVYSNQDGDSKRLKVKRYYLPKRIIRNYNVIINGKSFYDQVIDFNIKRYEEIRKLITGSRLYYWLLIRLRLYLILL